MTCTIFVEGGGTSKDLRSRCREGFAVFLRRMIAGRDQPKIVACGTRADAFKRLTIALLDDPTGAFLLLVDSESVVATGKAVWDHVRERTGDNWQRPTGAREDHLHFMAACMESWLIADPESLASFYGKNFAVNALPRTSNLESVEKDRLFDALRTATRDTTKGEYAKGKVSFAALSAIDASVVMQRMGFCKRLADRLNGTAVG